MMRVAAVIFLLVCLCAGCGGSEAAQSDAALPDSIVFPESLEFRGATRQRIDYTIPQGRYNVVCYQDSLACLGCHFSLEQWQEFADELDSLYPGKATVTLIFSPRFKREVRSAIQMSDYNRPVAFDIGDAFMKSNGIRATAGSFVALVDSAGRVVSTGNPVGDVSADWRFRNIIGGNGARELAAGAPAAEMVPDVVNLGEFDHSLARDTTVAIVNTGTEPMCILKVKVSCNCTAVDWSRKPIEPGDTTFMRVEYKSDRPTEVDRNILVYLSGGKRPLELRIVGTAK